MTSAKPTLMVECIIKYKYNASFPVQEYKLSIDYSLSVQGATGSTGATGSSGITALLTNEKSMKSTVKLLNRPLKFLKKMVLLKMPGLT